MAQLRSTPFAVRHQPAVLLPRALPSDKQCIEGARTRIWSVGMVPRGPPKKRTSWSRATSGPAEGQGWPSLHEPSISLAAMPARRILGPSAHQIGPSPSQTAVGVHVNEAPAATTRAAISSSMTKCYCGAAYRPSDNSNFRSKVTGWGGKARVSFGWKADSSPRGSLR
jgi:hypothetical protein